MIKADKARMPYQRITGHFVGFSFDISEASMLPNKTHLIHS
jgi:hypothetical protein